jgi:hypothetical protein
MAGRITGIWKVSVLPPAPDISHFGVYAPVEDFGVAAPSQDAVP